MNISIGNSGEQTQIAQARNVKRSGTALLPRTVSFALLQLFGGAATAAAVMLLPKAPVAPEPPAGTQAATVVAMDELDDAAHSLDPKWSDALLKKAKACEQPLFNIRVSKMTSEGKGIIRIRSGDYTSPPFAAREVPLNIAIPAPKPIPAGTGEIYVSGNVSNVEVALNPPYSIVSLPNNLVIPVWWARSPSCDEAAK